MQDKLVVIVGVGAVGSQVALELARCGVGQLRLIDHDVLEERNLHRHALPRAYLGRNKTTGMKSYLAHEFPQLIVEAKPWRVASSPDIRSLDRLFQDADLVIAATDDRGAQRLVGQRALALNVPAIFPALYADGGGEIILQLNSRFPCFFCWDGFRDDEEQLRDVSASNLEVSPIVIETAKFCVAALDPDSPYAARVWPGGGVVNQIFTLDRLGRVRGAPMRRRRPGCPSCSIGPAPIRVDEGETWMPPPVSPPLGPTSRPPRRSQLQPTPATSSLFGRLQKFFGTLGIGLFFWWLWCIGFAGVGWAIASIFGLSETSAPLIIGMLVIDAIVLVGILVMAVNDMFTD